jgi:hypothetical protein
MCPSYQERTAYKKSTAVTLRRPAERGRPALREVVKRKKNIEEVLRHLAYPVQRRGKFVFEKGCQQLIVGSGQIGNVRLSPEAEAHFAKKNCKVLLQPTPEAIHVFNRSTARKIGLFHVTC